MQQRKQVFEFAGGFLVATAGQLLMMQTAVF